MTQPATDARPPFNSGDISISMSIKRTAEKRRQPNQKPTRKLAKTG